MSYRKPRPEPVRVIEGEFNGSNVNDVWKPVVEISTGAIEKLQCGASIYKGRKEMSFKRLRLDNAGEFKYVGAFNVTLTAAPGLIEAIVKNKAQLLDALKSI